MASRRLRGASFVMLALALAMSSEPRGAEGASPLYVEIPLGQWGPLQPLFSAGLGETSYTETIGNFTLLGSASTSILDESGALFLTGGTRQSGAAIYNYPLEMAEYNETTGQCTPKPFAASLWFVVARNGSATVDGLTVSFTKTKEMGLGGSSLGYGLDVDSTNVASCGVTQTSSLAFEIDLKQDAVANDPAYQHYRLDRARSMRSVTVRAPDPDLRGSFEFAEATPGGGNTLLNQSSTNSTGAFWFVDIAFDPSTLTLSSQLYSVWGDAENGGLPGGFFPGAANPGVGPSGQSAALLSSLLGRGASGGNSGDLAANSFMLSLLQSEGSAVAEELQKAGSTLQGGAVGEGGAGVLRALGLSSSLVNPSSVVFDTPGESRSANFNLTVPFNPCTDAAVNSTGVGRLPAGQVFLGMSAATSGGSSEDLALVANAVLLFAGTYQESEPTGIDIGAPPPCAGFRCRNVRLKQPPVTTICPSGIQPLTFCCTLNELTCRPAPPPKRRPPPKSPKMRPPPKRPSPKRPPPKRPPPKYPPPFIPSVCPRKECVCPCNAPNLRIRPPSRGSKSRVFECVA